MKCRDRNVPKPNRLARQKSPVPFLFTRASFHNMKLRGLAYRSAAGRNCVCRFHISLRHCMASRLHLQASCCDCYLADIYTCMITEMVSKRNITFTSGNGKRSRLIRLKNDVPQGSVLAPLHCAIVHY